MTKRTGHYQLNRSTSQRTALFRSLVAALIERESISTSFAKAHAVQPIFEKLLTRALTGTVPARRHVQAYVQSGSQVTKLFSVIAPRYTGVMGGYTRITPIGFRRGDKAKMVKLALTKLSAPTQTTKATKADQASTVGKATGTTPKLTAPKMTQAKTVKLAAKRAGRRGDR